MYREKCECENSRVSSFTNDTGNWQVERNWSPSESEEVSFQHMDDDMATIFFFFDVEKLFLVFKILQWTYHQKFNHSKKSADLLKSYSHR